MKLKTHSIAFALRSRIVGRGLHDEHPVAPRRQPATNEEPPVRILDDTTAQDVPEAGPEDPENQLIEHNAKPKDTLWFCLLGIAITLYLLALIFILLV